MTIALNHTIVKASDKQVSATFFADVLGLGEPTAYGPFAVVQVGGVSLLFGDEMGPPSPQHYAFLVEESDFDAVLGRIRGRGLAHWADPFKQRQGEHNTEDGGRGVYWEDPDGHFLEIITRPYGSG